MLLKHKENFIIPFIYQSTYEEVCKQIKDDNYFSKIDELKETELHAFINRRFWQEENGHCEIYRVNANRGRDALVSLYDTKQDTDIHISDIRFYIFKSGIMFTVISAEYTRGAQGLSVDAVEEINAALKDLYTHKNRFLLFDKNLKLTQKLDAKVFENHYGYLTKCNVPDDMGKQKIMLTSVVKSKDEILVEAEVELFRDKQTGAFIDFEDGFFAPVKNKASMIKCYRQGDYSLADIVQTVNSHLGILFSDYFSGSSNTALPKKAVVFNMHVVKKKDTADLREHLFHLAHGYSHSYKCPKEEGHIVSAFDNSYWNVTREGVANINMVDEADGDKFLLQYFDGKFDSVYLWIYLLVLHQYYGLQYFTCKLLKVYQESLIIERNDTKKEYHKLLGQMEEIKNNGDLFLLEYTFADISQISHQNDIYAHISEVYNIKGLIEDYSTNAEICDKILAKKQQKALQKKVNFIAAVTTFFTLFTSVTQTVMGLFELGGTFSFVLRVLLGIAGIGLVVIGLMKNK